MAPVEMGETRAPALPLRLRARAAFISGRFDLVGLCVALVALCILFTSLTPFFPTFPNLKALGVAVSYNAILAAGQTVVIVGGLIDLSFTAVLALSGIAAQKLLLLGVPFPLVLLGALALGGCCGLLNAAICVAGGVNPLIATIGTGLALRGLAFIWLGLGSMPYFNDTALNFLGNGMIAGLPAPLILCVGVIAAIWIMMRFTRFGSRVYAMGGNETATRLSGVSVAQLKTRVFVLSGVFGAVGGLLLTSLNGTAFADAGRGDELVVIAAVILGGTALSGGRGSVIGTALAVLVLGVMANGMNLLGIDAFWQLFLSGVILLLAVVIDEQRNRARAR
ncbi:MAG: ABC transporter permease [Dongiaceae bacterium]